MTGNCTFTAGFAHETTPGRICYNAGSKNCSSVNTSLAAGVALENCTGNIRIEAFQPVFNYTVLSEFPLNATFIQGEAMVGIVCDVNENLNSSQPLVGHSTPVTIGPRTCISSAGGLSSEVDSAPQIVGGRSFAQFPGDRAAAAVMEAILFVLL